MQSDFMLLMRAEVLPHRAANPDHVRLDGTLTGGNRKAAGRFQYQGIEWVVHADSHYEPLLIAFEAMITGMDPFDVENTPRGQCLVLKPELRDQERSTYKHLYIYSSSESARA